MYVFVEPLGGAGGDTNVNISLYMEQKGVLGGGWEGALESEHVNISLYVEKNYVLGGGWLGEAGAPEGLS